MFKVPGRTAKQQKQLQLAWAKMVLRGSVGQLRRAAGWVGESSDSHLFKLLDQLEGEFLSMLEFYAAKAGIKGNWGDYLPEEQTRWHKKSEKSIDRFRSE